MGTGHVMRCLTLARELQQRNHEAVLVINQHDISWLNEEITRSGIITNTAPVQSLHAEEILTLNPDIVVVDSYWIDPVDISELNTKVPVVAIVDGDTRGIDCSLYIDQNLGSEIQWSGKYAGKVLAGSRYALIREEITRLSPRQAGQLLGSTPNVLIFAGGTDATGVIPEILTAVDQVDEEFSMTVIAGEQSFLKHLQLVHSTNFTSATTEFDSLLGRADIVIGAAGTSSWEICTLGIPSIFLAVVENQLQVISAIEKARCGETINLVADRNLLSSQLQNKLNALLTSQELRAEFSRNCEEHFDGMGSSRVAEVLESLSLNQ